MENIHAAVEKHRERILTAERFLWAHPETGYREFETSKYMADAFRSLGYDITEAEGLTGFYTVIDTGRPGPEVLVLGELDAVLCPSHPDADPKTGAVHACGHHAQSAALLGIAAALREPRLLDGLCGRIRLCAVPAEELLEIGYRTELKKMGKIKYFGGKTEFLRRGYFDGVDMALMVHTASAFAMDKGSVGCLVKQIVYLGKASHAGGHPEGGVNALYAATCGIQAVNALRETFRESDQTRVHPIITEGGQMVNAIPARVVLESYVRGRSFDAITKENKKINRALTGAALSMGANVEIIDTPGYAPHHNDENMLALCRDAAIMAMPGVELKESDKYSSGSTDMGDLSCVMPVVQPFAAGATGTSHGSDYAISNPVAACVTGAKWQLCMLKLLLSHNAERAKKILAAHTPLFSSKKAYLTFLDALNNAGERIAYNDDGTATVRLD